MLTFESLKKYTKTNIDRAMGNAELIKKAEAMNIEFPNYKIRPCDYELGDFTTLFLDIRGSTTRAMQIGAKKTFVTVHALLPTLAKVVDELEGFIVDYPGDGIMAHWDTKDKNYNPAYQITSTVKAACFMEDAVSNIVNPLLAEVGIPSITCGIGLASGPVIITKVGIPGYLSAKAIGDSVNKAAKLSGGLNQGKILADVQMIASAFKDTTSPGTAEINYKITGDIIEIEATNKFKLPRELDSSALRMMLGSALLEQSKKLVN